MRVTNIGLTLAALALTTLAASAQAAPKRATTKAATPAAAAVVKLGGAMLEEYRGGDPAGRTTIYRGGESARKPAPAAKQKPQS